MKPATAHNVKTDRLIQLFNRYILLKLSAIFKFATLESDLDQVEGNILRELIELDKTGSWIDKEGKHSSHFCIERDPAVLEEFENRLSASARDSQSGGRIAFYTGRHEEKGETIFGVLLSYKDQVARYTPNQSWFRPIQKTGIELVVNSENRERNRLAIDLHDSIGQQLTGIRFLIESITSESEDTRDKLSRTKKAIDSCILELRDISYNLIPKPLDQESLHFTLQDFFNRLNHQFGVKYHLELNDLDVIDLIKSFEISLFRIIQELISNSIKHGGADRFLVQASLMNDALEVTIEENGHGFDRKKNTKRKSRGLGLYNIETRVSNFDGHFKSYKAEKQGIIYKIRFPRITIEKS